MGVDSFQLSCAALIAVAVSAGLIYLGARRRRLWRKTLAQPASDFTVQPPSWIMLLPHGVQLNSNFPLFEVLYKNFRAQPKKFAPSAVNQALFGTGASSGQLILTSGEKFSDEEKIKGLMNAPQESGAIPVDALAQNLVLNLVNVLKGKKKLSVGVEHAVLDSLGAGGGFAGAKLGSVVGLTLAPFLASIAAVALPLIMICGAWFGAVLGKKIGGRVKARHRYTALKKLNRISKNFKKSFLLRFPELMAQLDRDFVGRIAFTRVLFKKQQNLMMRVFFPNLMTAFFEMSLKRLKHDWAEDREEWRQIKRKVKSMHALEFSNVLHGLSAQAFDALPELHCLYEEYELALEDLKKADLLAA